MDPVTRGGPLAFAHGKIILLGEHAVVYGTPALCGALADGVSIEALPGDGALVIPAWGLRTLPAPDLSRAGAAVQGCAVSRAYAAILASLRVERAFGFDLLARFAIPAGAGLGSSAALSVALARALDRLLDLGAGEEAIAAAALAAEQVFHGRPSGLDHTVAQQGGFGIFRRASGLAPLRAPAVPLLIGLTGRPRDTRGRVGRVAELLDEQPDRMRGYFAAIGHLVEAASRAVRDRDLRTLGEAMTENQAVLRHLEVSCPEIEEMCAIALRAGAAGAKLTGGGGGGSVIALAPGREGDVMAAWQEAGFSSFRTTVGDCAGEGVP